MSNYWPTILELFLPFPLSEEIVLSLMNFLETDHLASFSDSHELDNQGTFSASTRAILGPQEIWIEIQATRNSHISAIGEIFIRLDSKAYELVFDVIKQQVHVKGRKELMMFCAKIAKVTKAEGFLLRFDNQIHHSLDFQGFIRSVTSLDGNSNLLIGVAMSSSHWVDIQPYWLDWTAVEGYGVKDFF
jgi:hypothetical protein